MKKIKVWIEWDTGTEAGVRDYVLSVDADSRYLARRTAREKFLTENPHVKNEDIIGIDSWYV